MSDLDQEQLWADTNKIITDNDLQDCFQISYSSIDGENNWLDIRPQLESPDGTTLEMAKKEESADVVMATYQNAIWAMTLLIHPAWPAGAISPL